MAGLAFVLSGVSYSLYSTSSNASNSYVLSFLSSQVDESRNESKENDTIDDIGSSPLKSVGEILLDSVVLLNPDVLADGRFAEVSAIQSTDRLRGVLNKSASAVHEEYCPKKQKEGENGDERVFAATPFTIHLVVSYCFCWEPWQRVFDPKSRESSVRSKERKCSSRWR